MNDYNNSIKAKENEYHKFERFLMNVSDVIIVALSISVGVFLIGAIICYTYQNYFQKNNEEIP